MSANPIKREVTIGDCRLILGDCLDVLPTLRALDAYAEMTERHFQGGQIVGSVVSDPPYGIAYKSGYATDALWGAARTINSDENLMSRDAVVAWAAGNIPILLFGSWKVNRPKGTKMVLIWNKGGALGMGDLSLPWKPDHEEIYVLGKGFIGTRDSGSVLYCPPVQSMAKNGRLHPTEKPVDLMKNLCRKVPGTILDPFMGSGSTGVACAKTGRSFIGIEIDERYFEIACERIRKAYAQPDMFVAPPVKHPVQEPLFGEDAA